MLNVIIDDLDDAVVLRCVGSLVHGHETELLCPALGENDRSILLDLSLVDRIDAAGIGALIALQAAGSYLKIVNPAKPVAEVLRVTHVDSLFEIVHTEEPRTGAPDFPSAERPSGIRAIA